MSKKLNVNIPAPDFELQDTRGETIRLSAWRGKQPVVLVFNRGFV